MAPRSVWLLASNLTLRPLGNGRPFLFWTFIVTRFPPRASAAIFVCRERAGDGWLALAGSYGWLFSTINEARDEAKWLSANFGLPVREMVVP